MIAQLPTKFTTMIENKKKQGEISNKSVLNKSKQQLGLFKKAILAKDLVLLEPLLYNQFKYFDVMDKLKTLEYFKEQFNKEIPEMFIKEDADEIMCMDCSPGSPVLYFHTGFWPIIEGANIPKGIMLRFTDGLISDLTLCFKFCYPNNVKCFYGQKYSNPSQMPIQAVFMMSVSGSLHITGNFTLHNHPPEIRHPVRKISPLPDACVKRVRSWGSKCWITSLSGMGSL